MPLTALLSTKPFSSAEDGKAIILSAAVTPGTETGTLAIESAAIKGGFTLIMNVRGLPISWTFFNLRVTVFTAEIVADCSIKSSSKSIGGIATTLSAVVIPGIVTGTFRTAPAAIIGGSTRTKAVLCVSITRKRLLTWSKSVR